MLCLYCEKPMEFLDDESRAAAEQAKGLVAHTACYDEANLRSLAPIFHNGRTKD